MVYEIDTVNKIHHQATKETFGIMLVARVGEADAVAEDPSSDGGPRTAKFNSRW
jgi:hypothetical protein